MSLIRGDIASKHKDEAKSDIGRIVYQHFQERDKYESEEKFASDLSEKIIDKIFIHNAFYTEELVVKMLNDLLSEK
ncbi:MULTISPECIES: hypothetical protein [unclassified Virgibacillus]|uniref:hypothetical protein n=1 Tax=unclassified Virgibacillus TaxID=2620237 RepID=UPI0009099083|nr:MULTISPECIES: hypothetical protein [unclassified Virgibacillus]API92726.1 hypothetical protein BKP57_13465 [Virgibacillus sp. 6R]MBS7428223.1 hypothetical protein [Virgibacillus sp. 19R1-5]